MRKDAGKHMYNLTSYASIQNDRYYFRKSGKKILKIVCADFRLSINCIYSVIFIVDINVFTPCQYQLVVEDITFLLVRLFVTFLLLAKYFVRSWPKHHFPGGRSLLSLSASCLVQAEVPAKFLAARSISGARQLARSDILIYDSLPVISALNYNSLFILFSLHTCSQGYIHHVESEDKQYII